MVPIGEGRLSLGVEFGEKFMLVGCSGFSAEVYRIENLLHTILKGSVKMLK